MWTRGEAEWVVGPWLDQLWEALHEPEQTGRPPVSACSFSDGIPPGWFSEGNNGGMSSHKFSNRYKFRATSAFGLFPAAFLPTLMALPPVH